MAYLAKAQFNPTILALLIAALIILWPKNTCADVNIPGPVVFDEIMWTGSSISTADEWLVLYNTSYTPIVLNGWKVQRLDAGSDVDMVSLSGTIPALGYYLLSNNSADHMFSGGESILNIAPDMIETDVSLSNTNLKLTLCHDDCLGANISDIAGDGKTPPAGRNTNPKASMKRADYTLLGNVKSAWRTNTEQLNLDTTATEMATPRNAGLFEVNLSTLKPKVRLGDESIISVDIVANNPWPVTITVNGQPAGEFDDPGIQLPVKPLNIGDNVYLVQVEGANGMTVEESIIISAYDVGLLTINEVNPRADNDKTTPWDTEWLEIINNDTVAINLYGWSICDLADHCQTLDDVAIAPSATKLIFAQKPLSLNDDNEAIRLINPESTVVSSMSWSKSYPLCTYSQFDGAMRWSTVATPGDNNAYSICPAPKIVLSTGSQPSSAASSQVAAMEEPSPPQAVIITVVKHIITSAYNSELLTGLQPINKIDMAKVEFTTETIKSNQPAPLEYPPWWWLAVFVLVIFRRGYQMSMLVLRL